MVANASNPVLNIIPAADLAGYWWDISALAADSEGNLYVVEPMPTTGTGNTPLAPKVASNAFLPAIFIIIATTTPDPYDSSSDLLQDWTTSTVETTSVTTSSSCRRTTGGGTTDCLGDGSLKNGGGAPGPYQMVDRQSPVDYSGIAGIALSKSNSSVTLYAARSLGGNTPQVLIVPSPAALNQAISVMTAPGGGTWGTPVAVAVASNVAYSGSDAVFISDSGSGGIYWYNEDQAANSHGNYTPFISGDGSNNFGNSWASGPYTGQTIGNPASIAVLPLINMEPRMYIALSTGGVVYFHLGNALQPLSDGAGGCPFAKPLTLNIITAMTLDDDGNLYLTGLPPSASGEAHVCKMPAAQSPYIFEDGDVLISNALEEPTGIAVSCQQATH